ncbi:hypothetical protein [Solidesulfovibrio alcoholivorans]|uniref:hypothetical protein n=1 Tax=Solidesulfovibrio alcoholivorans TaxID=81406 RepID=UPI0004959897|nr:hypothetical protein [Solidesulfovibrio alcoholivorans]
MSEQQNYTGGPKSAAGKAIVATNAITHGLTAKELVLPGERKADLVALRQSLVADLRPVGDMEALLVERVALCLWRLRRVMRFEAGYMGNGLGAPKHRDPYGDFISHFQSADKLVLLTRYETAIERSMYRALGELRAMKEARGQAGDGSIDVTPAEAFVS